MADLTISVDIDAKGTKAGASAVKSEIKGITSAADQAGRSFKSVASVDYRALETKLKSVGQTMQQMGGQIQSAGTTMSLAITAPLVALGTLGIKSALEVDAVRTKITALVGDAAKANAKILELRELSAKSVGVTQKTALETYAQLKGIGGIAEESINRVISAMGKLNAAFKIEDQGAFMRNLVQLFSQGFEIPDLKEAVGRVPIFYQLLEQAFGTRDPEKLRALKAAGKLTLDSFMTGLSDAIQSDSRTGNITDNLTTKLAKAFEKLNVALAPLGQAILDLVMPAFERLGPLIERAGKWFQELSPEARTAAVAVLGIAAAIGPVLIAIGSLVVAIGNIVMALGTVAGAVGAAGGIGTVALIIAGIGLAIAPVVVWIGLLYKAWQTNFGGIRELTMVVVQAIGEAWNGLMAALKDLTQAILAEVQVFWKENGDQILEIVRAFSEAFRIIWVTIVNFWRENHGTIKEVAMAIWTAIKEIVVGAIRIIGDVITIFLKVFKGDWKGAFDASVDILKVVVVAWKAVMDAGVAVVLGAVKLLFQAIWDLDGWVREQASHLGRALIQGLIRGILSLDSELRGAMKRMAQAAIDAAKGILKIESPSKVMHEIGQRVGEGLADGMDDSSVKVAEAAATMSSQVMTGLNMLFGGDFKSFLANVFDTLTDSSRSWSDRLRTIFGNIAQSFRRMISDMVTNWINSKLFGGSGSGSGSGMGPGGTPMFNGGGGGSIFNSTPGATGSINSAGQYVVNGSQGGGNFFQGLGFSKNIFTGKEMSSFSKTLSGIGAIASMVGGMIPGQVGNTISMAGMGMSIGAMFGPWGALIGAAGGALIGLLMGDPKRKRDKKEKMPQLAKGFTDSLSELRQLITDVRTLRVSPDSAIPRAIELRSAIASGFGIQMESGKYRKIAQQQIAQKLVEADALIAELRQVAEVSRAATERDRRLLPEFAGGVYMSPAFQAFRRRNGMLGGTFNGRDTLPSMLAPGEMVLNPGQMQRVKANAGFDVFKTAGIPGYAGGGVAQSGPVQMGDINVTVVVEQDASGIWHATAQSDAGQKVIAKVVESKYANDEIKLKRRGT